MNPRSIIGRPTERPERETNPWLKLDAADWKYLLMVIIKVLGLLIAWLFGLGLVVIYFLVSWFSTSNALWWGVAGFMAVYVAVFCWWVSLWTEEMTND